ncbi:MAG TPA: FAD-dependent oxidoreductase [Solirubrobacterales bacterium]|nr:FAD-dependent oxidoreductase [Solirubrobacterales bacterium]
MPAPAPALSAGGPVGTGGPWGTHADLPPHPALAGEIHADVAVVGAGITGVTTALLLQESGASVALLEADRICSGVSSHTTAKVTALQGTTYTRLLSRFGVEGASIYARWTSAAVDWIGEQAEKGAIECSFRRRADYTFAADASQRDTVEEQAEAAAAAGLPVELVDDLALPFDHAGAVALPGQAEFDPVAYVGGLARRFEEAGGRIHERSRVLSVSEGNPCQVRTTGGSVLAGQVVLATLIPILDRSLAFAREHPERSYCIGVSTPDAAPEGMFISAGSPTRSLRRFPAAGRELLIVGGEGHKTGQTGSHRERYAQLEEFARRHWDVEAVTHRWSAQDYVTADGGPYVGPVNPLSKRLYMATGFAKWGMTNGTAAARALHEALNGATPEWCEAFAANRLKPLASAASLVKENANAGAVFFTDRIRRRPSRGLSDLAPGEGAVVRGDGGAVAGYRDPDGRLHAVSPTCTHLACRVRFNDAEHTWDCPCHGSRFAPDGSVLQGPATRPLERKRVPPGEQRA